MSLSEKLLTEKRTRNPNRKKTCPKCGTEGVSDGVFFCSNKKCGYYEEE